MKKLIAFLILVGLLLFSGCDSGGYTGYYPQSSTSYRYLGPDNNYQKTLDSFAALDQQREQEREHRRFEQQMEELKRQQEQYEQQLWRMRQRDVFDQSPYGKSLLTGRRPSYGDSLLKDAFK